VLAHDEHPLAVVAVVAVGALAAHGGDVTTFLALRRAGGPLGRRLPWLRVDDPEGVVRSVGDRLERNAPRALVVGRLLPGGRIPVVLAAALGGMTPRRFATANVAAVLVWAAAYAAIGFAGGALLADSTVAILVAVVGAFALTGLLRLVRGRRADG
jgi:membrane protein DedA with SNARE-associated domain